jgi:hypothetical protein
MLLELWVQMPSQAIIGPAEVIAQVHPLLEQGTHYELDLTLARVSLKHVDGSFASPQHRANHDIADL